MPIVSVHKAVLNKKKKWNKQRTVLTQTFSWYNRHYFYSELQNKWTTETAVLATIERFHESMNVNSRQWRSCDSNDERLSQIVECLVEDSPVVQIDRWQISFLWLFKTRQLSMTNSASSLLLQLQATHSFACLVRITNQLSIHRWSMKTKLSKNEIYP